MEDNITLNAQLRTESGKGVARKLRAQGALPGVFYLGNKENLPIQLNGHELQLALKQKPSILNLQLDDGQVFECVIRELQLDPVSGKSLHIDLMGIVRGQKVTVSVSIELTGSAFGVRDQGGVLQHAVHSVDVECLPKHIPEVITLDIEELKIGSSLQVRDLEVENVKILDDEDKTVVSVLAPRVEIEVEEEVEEEELEGEEAEGEEAEGEAAPKEGKSKKEGGE
ncbi:50S ribosomal protein L25/general stress protein Ctc [candidate division LCP-89 bacterium B3_LCP]|uniref:Large ribosomal subunit protein bL25 n=1 Tax=candidate division LCP-89 bacterium B3_LCP TaxID=2012998 RepID=A0A532UZQ9_UNCL8|nr:MAG: 50S ribosomal protein L25/general stress protein Ctc [candidate division LCP-89 bacterium B3_LCP]